MDEPLLIPVRALRDGAQLPRRMTSGASGFDLCACLPEPIDLAPGEWRAIPTGLCFAIPDGFEGVVRARSGLALRHGLGLVNGAGTIDSDYRGELQVLLMNWGRAPYRIASGERIAQLVIQRLPSVRVEWGEVLLDTDRGEGGFGHTGRHGAS